MLSLLIVPTVLMALIAISLWTARDADATIEIKGRRPLQAEKPVRQIRTVRIFTGGKRGEWQIGSLANTFRG